MNTRQIHSLLRELHKQAAAENVEKKRGSAWPWVAVPAAVGLTALALLSRGGGKRYLEKELSTQGGHLSDELGRAAHPAQRAQILAISPEARTPGQRAFLDTADMDISPGVTRRLGNLGAKSDLSDSGWLSSRYKPTTVYPLEKKPRLSVEEGGRFKGLELDDIPKSPRAPPEPSDRFRLLELDKTSGVKDWFARLGKKTGTFTDSHFGRFGLPAAAILGGLALGLRSGYKMRQPAQGYDQGQAMGPPGGYTPL